MSKMPLLLNRIVGPFITGALMAATTTSNDLASIVTLLALASVSGFVSLPGNEQLIKRALEAVR